MKITLLIFLTPFTLLGQVIEDEVKNVLESPDGWKSYKSKEEDTYYENNKYQDFIPESIDIVKKHRLKHVKILLSEEGNSKQEVDDTNIEKIKRDMEYLDPKNRGEGSIKRNSILSHSNSKGVTVTLFLDSKYDEFMWREPGYWINLTDKNGSSDYYTGLAQNYYIKILNSNSSVWKSDSTLLFSGVQVRLVEPFIHPVSAPKYETIDNVKVEISISDLARDTDKDGLTDIEEDKFMLNSQGQDTDGDGTNDFEDHNPRFKSVTTGKSLVYKALLDNYISDTIRIRSNKIIDSKRPRLIHTLKSQTRLIVSDDPDLQKVDFEYDRTIILTSQEYKTSKANYPVTLDETNVSPLFKVDDMVDTFVVSVSQDLGGQRYLVKKLKDGFDIVQIESWIH
jgi:hypothetical protein